jgi:uncharacterized SAM-binding protein YcdF (DUF218 family)
LKFRIITSIFILLIIVVLVHACRNLGLWLVKDDELVDADAIIILMGTITDRVLQADDVYQKGYANRVIIVREDMGGYNVLEERGVHIISSTLQGSNALSVLGIPSDSITILPGDATSTQMEAMMFKEYLANKPGIDTLLLVSSAPHTCRASMIFKAVFRKAKMPVHIICCPSAYTDFNAKNWWWYKEDFQEVLLEYMKITNFLLFENRRL